MVETPAGIAGNRGGIPTINPLGTEFKPSLTLLEKETCIRLKTTKRQADREAHLPVSFFIKKMGQKDLVYKVCRFTLDTFCG